MLCRMCNKRAEIFCNQKQRIENQAENPFPLWGRYARYS
ncbi:hypothetical protein ECP030526015_0265 [Escherichia coli P0305260.15]|nr:hypothetical protein EC3006_0325 [Escherichia coli 3006]ENE13548.1 hypothetical protein ECP03052602_0271 [Escherichia coli P0305260.2]ENG00694.1 hypothetical protein ECP030526015_0265 [Escherichia coli P0305260.15]KDU60399.1 hypothetical protein AB21_4129 [Escherichia coli 4-203-08_S1_C1]KDY21229.1 hypothetical protein AD00_1612 [Escherichia coli 2-316-03_S4_C2]